MSRRRWPTYTTVGDANFSRLLSFTDPLAFDVDMNYGCSNLFAPARSYIGESA